MIKDDIMNLINRHSFFIATMEPTDDDKYLNSLKEIANELRDYFQSEYCAIGKVDDKVVEDCYVSVIPPDTEPKLREQAKTLKDLKRASIDKDCLVCRAIKSGERCYSEGSTSTSENKETYIKSILPSHNIKGVTTITVRGNEKEKAIGFIQFINSVGVIDETEISYLYESLQRLCLAILRRDKSKESYLFKADLNFFLDAQRDLHNIDHLLERIMVYLSKEFNAGIVSFRIPLLVGLDRSPLFFLRDCYIHERVSQYYSREEYFNNKLVKTGEQLGGYDKLICDKRNDKDYIIIENSKRSEYNEDYKNRFQHTDIQFHDDALIIPILRDYTRNNECPKNGKQCNRADCLERFQNYFGIFKLRIFKKPDTVVADDNASEWLTEETKERLKYLASHISILMNSIVDKNENDSLDIFKTRLKNTSFVKIKEFDKKSAEIIKEAVHAKICAIFRYENTVNRKLTLNACTIRDTKINDIDITIHPTFEDNIIAYKKKYSINEPSNNYIDRLFDRKAPIYYSSNARGNLNSIMVIPMIKNDNTRLGVMLLVGKEPNQDKDIKPSPNNISLTFWEHDIRQIDFIVNVLTRIEESDSERLTFLSQLSHELRGPFAEIVNRNEYIIETVKNHPNRYSAERLLSEMENDVNICMSIKSIIDDITFIYSLSKNEAQYQPSMTDVKKIIKQVIRQERNEAWESKRITIKANLDEMPEQMYVDRTRIKQVVTNLIRNAIQYSTGGEDVVISYTFNSEKNCHEIDFSDNGIPVLKDDIDKIFKLNERSKLAIRKRPSGTGIGLYIVKEIMKAHDGNCIVKHMSYPTTFTIQIPNK